MKFPPLICHPCLVRFRQGIMSEKLDTAVDTLTSPVSRCKNDFHDWKRRKRETNLIAKVAHVEKLRRQLTITQQPSVPKRKFLATEDIRSEFGAIKDALTKIKLPADLRLCDSRQGIRRSAETTYNILSRCARYAETSNCLLSSPKTISTTIQCSSYLPFSWPRFSMFKRNIRFL